MQPLEKGTPFHPPLPYAASAGRQGKSMHVSAGVRHDPRKKPPALAPLLETTWAEIGRARTCAWNKGGGGTFCSICRQGKSMHVGQRVQGSPSSWYRLQMARQPGASGGMEKQQRAREVPGGGGRRGCKIGNEGGWPPSRRTDAPRSDPKKKKKYGGETRRRRKYGGSGGGEMS